MIVDNPRRALAGGTVGPKDFRPALGVTGVLWSDIRPGALEIVAEAGRSWSAGEVEEIRSYVESTTDVEQAVRLGLAQDIGELRSIVRATGTSTINRLFARVLLRLALLALHRVDSPDPDATAASSTSPASSAAAASPASAVEQQATNKRT